MTDKDDFAAFEKVALRFEVDLVDKRAGCIESEHIAVLGVFDHGLGDTMC